MTFRAPLFAALVGGLLVLAASPDPAHAAPCYVGPKSEGTVETQNGKISYSPGTYIDDCAGIYEAVGGLVDFCPTNEDGNLDCKPLQPGERREVPRMDDTSKFASMKQVFIAFFHPGEQRQEAMKRLRDTNAPPEGLPEGAVLMPPGGLEFSGPRAGLEGIDRLTVAPKDGPGTPLFTNPAPAPKVEVPRDVLRPGGAYRWKLSDGAETLEGGFTVAEAEDQQDFEAELAGLLEGSGPDPSTRNLVRAVLAKQYGYTYDMFLALEAARDSASMAEPKAVYGARPDGETMP